MANTRGKRTSVAGSGKQWTVMVYMAAGDSHDWGGFVAAGDWR